LFKGETERELLSIVLEVSQPLWGCGPAENKDSRGWGNLFTFSARAVVISSLKVLVKEGNSLYHNHVLLLWGFYNDIILLVRIINKGCSMYSIRIALLFLGYDRIG